MASFNRKLKKQKEKINKINEKKIDAVTSRDKDLLNKYISEINISKSYGNEKSIKVTDEIFLQNLKKFMLELEPMSQKGQAKFEKSKADLAFAGINTILETKELRVTTLRYFMLLVIFQLWEITPFHNSEEFEQACIDSNLNLLKSGFWHDNLHLIKYINRYFYFTFDHLGAFEITIR